MLAQCVGILVVVSVTGRLSQSKERKECYSLPQRISLFSISKYFSSRFWQFLETAWYVDFSWSWRYLLQVGVKQSKQCGASSRGWSHLARGPQLSPLGHNVHLTAHEEHKTPILPFRAYCTCSFTLTTAHGYFLPLPSHLQITLIFYLLLLFQAYFFFLSPISIRQYCPLTKETMATN